MPTRVQIPNLFKSLGKTFSRPAIHQCPLEHFDAVFGGGSSLCRHIQATVSIFSDLSAGPDAIRQNPHVAVYRSDSRTTPIPIFLLSRSGYFRRAFSASSFVLKGFDRMMSSRPWYSNSSHRTDDFIREF